MAETQDVILRQADDESLRVQHHGSLRVQGDARADALEHRAEVVHSTPPDRPLVHMVLWDEDCACEVDGRITVAGDEAAPLHARLRHSFDTEHRQTHRIESALAMPVHHALQMRTPLQVRFCNTWQIASDYSIEIRLGQNRVIGVHLTGATIAKPLPCEDEAGCEPVVTHPLHP